MPPTGLNSAGDATGPPGAGSNPVCAGLILRGVGIDAERVERFEKLAADGRFWRHVCSPREARHLASQPHPGLAFGAAFCCKEALCKALGAAFAFPECECLYADGASGLDLVLAPGLRDRHRLAGARARFHERFLADRGEFVAEVRLYGAPTSRGDDSPAPPPDGIVPALPVRSHLETIAIAEVERCRLQVEEGHFSPAELADLAARRVQSLAGFLALKRALAALAAEAGPALRAAPRDFELSHRASGAPCLVSAPEGIAVPDVFVSISHTRAWVYGLAAIGGCAPGG